MTEGFATQPLDLTGTSLQFYENQDEDIPFVLSLGEEDIDDVEMASISPANEEEVDDSGLTSILSADEEELDDDISSQAGQDITWELRPRHNIIIPTTWLDNDKSKDYDPKQESREARSKCLQSKKRKRSQLDDEDDGARPSRNTGVRERCVVVCKMSAERLREFWDKSENDDEDIEGHYRLRSRREDLDQSAGVAPDLPQDLTGYPIARGCWACVRLGIDCSILDDERQWPCQACAADGSDCVLITAPLQKRPCQQCKEDCSYTYTRNHNGPCKKCGDRKFECVAGPVKEHIRPRIRYDRDWDADPLPKGKRKITVESDCRECSLLGRPCQRPLGAIPGPCRACVEQDLPCTNNDHRRKSSAGKKGCAGPAIVATTTEDSDTDMIDHVDDEDDDDADDDDHMNDSDMIATDRGGLSSASKRKVAPESRRKAHQRSRKERQRRREVDTSAVCFDSPPSGAMGVVITDDIPPDSDALEDESPSSVPARRTLGRLINTSFCHPVAFNHDTPDGVCDFCREPIFAVYGFGARTVRVADTADGSAWRELSGGHSAFAVGPSQMCTPCTTARLGILLCNVHEMQPIPDLAISVLEEELAYDELLRGAITTTARMCSVCLRLAVYRCAAGYAGCGLQLCEPCMVRMVGQHDNDLAAMLDVVPDDDSTSDEEIGLRADTEFLRSDGALYMYLVWRCGRSAND